MNIASQYRHQRERETGRRVLTSGINTCSRYSSMIDIEKEENAVFETKGIGHGRLVPYKLTRDDTKHQQLKLKPPSAYSDQHNEPIESQALPKAWLKSENYQAEMSRMSPRSLRLWTVPLSGRPWHRQQNDRTCGCQRA
jgi:hypothetical protein